jgi:hypothetical protein
MAYQKTMKNGPSDTVSGVLDEMGGLGSNVVTLGVLQAQLAVEDLRDSARRSFPAMVAAAILVPLFFASAVVGLLGIAHWLATAWAVSLSRALLLVAGSGAGLSVLLTIGAIIRFRDSLDSFRRSREELTRNITWLGTVLARSGR